MSPDQTWHARIGGMCGLAHTARKRADLGLALLARVRQNVHHRHAPSGRGRVRPRVDPG